MERSPLMKLPAEIRNDIYDLAAYVSGGIAFKLVPTDAEDQQGSPTSLKLRLAPLTSANDNPNPVALAATCKALRLETMGSFYAVNDFSVTLGCGSSPVSERVAAIRVWLNGISCQHRKALKSLQIDAGRWTGQCRYSYNMICVNATGAIEREILQRFPDLKISNSSVSWAGRYCKRDCEPLHKSKSVLLEHLKAHDQDEVAKYAHRDKIAPFHHREEGHSCHDEALRLSGYGEGFEGARICRVCTHHFEAMSRITIKGNCG